MTSIMPIRRWLLLTLALLALAGCQHPELADQVGGSTPQAAVQGSIDQLRTGNLAGLFHHALPPADYAMLRADWQRPASPPLLDTGYRVKLDAALRELRMPDADQRVYAQLQPWLDHMQQQYGDQIPVLLAMEGAVLKQRLVQNPDLDPAQQAQVAGLIDTLVPWLQQAPWSDPAHTRQAVAIAANTVGRLGVGRIEQLRTLDFAAATRRCTAAWQGLKQLLAVYGLPVDRALASARLTTVSSQPGRAVVRIDYSLLGKPLAFDTTVVQRDGRWYSEALIDAVHGWHARLQAPAQASTVAHSAAVPRP